MIEILEHAGIDVFQVEGRVKTPDSFDEKIKRKAGKYADPLSDMTDLVGLRIIAYYLEDVDRIVELLSDEFEVRKEHSMNKQDELAPDQFGYSSNHLVIRIGSRSQRPEWAKYADISVELQVRTMSQHAWAAVHHKLSYKRVEEVPTSLQRRLFRLSALFEMADEQFSAIRRTASELSDEYSDNVKQGNLDIEIDADSIDAYIQNSAKVRGIVAIGNDEFNLSLIPPDGFRTETTRSRLLRIAAHLQVRTIEGLDRLLPSPDETREILSLLRAVGDEVYPDRKTGGIAVEHEILSSLLIVLYDVPKVLHESLQANPAVWRQYYETRERLRSRQ
ncbi:hypothetical protein [Lentzea sp. NPDC051838]|uniref:GTP pyrophosphokinase n=1 Tax=Lentzea sp. NPDC051838 TaxID=3154849 RepID=UPI00343FCC39